METSSASHSSRSLALVGTRRAERHRAAGRGDRRSVLRRRALVRWVMVLGLLAVAVSAAGCSNLDGERPVSVDDEQMAELQGLLDGARTLTDFDLPAPAVAVPLQIDETCPVADGVLLGQPNLWRSWTIEGQ